MEEDFDDGWDDIAPDFGDYKTTWMETLLTVAIFFGKVVGYVLLGALILFALFYPVWREIMIFNFLTGGA